MIHIGVRTGIEVNHLMKATKGTARNTIRRQLCLLLAVCSLLAAQFVWAIHSVEHCEHDDSDICVVCLHAERVDDFMDCSPGLVAINSPLVTPEFPTLNLLEPGVVFANYRARASP